jgi:protein-tyrosine phosphatase
LKASSAGILAVIAHPIHQEAAVVLERLGGDASDFAARQLTPRIAADADLVLTMTKEHRDKVLELAPHRLRSTFTLIEAARLATTFGAQTVADLAELRPHVAADAVHDIPDPIGQSEEVFSTVGSQIAELLPPVLNLLRND